MQVTRVIRVLALCAVSLLGVATAHAVDLADAPIFTINSVPGNMLFVLSVEYPTANAAAYPAAKAKATTKSGYTTASTYIGYFDPTKCYSYDPSFAPTGATNKGLFSPYGPASNHACASSKSAHLWSGNFLNWASMQALDEFRSALTGGYRVVDTTTQTVLEKTWVSSQGNTSDDPDGLISNSSSTIQGATPFSNWSTLKSSTFGQGNVMLLTSSGSFSSTPTNYNGQVPTSTSPVYAVTIRVLVCDPSVSLEADCTAYGTNFKPEGLIQQNALNIRYGAVSYLDDGSSSREGGVLRARMAYVGPKMPSTTNPSTTVDNPAPEWSPDTGIFYANPDPNDATDSGVANSGVVNYINKFGEFSHIYKSGDNLSELFYAGLRYYKHLGNIPSYSANATSTMLDGFPAIVSWDDPILYACQKNFFVGIGDVNTHDDTVVPGSTLTPTGGQTVPNFSPDTTDYKAETDLVGVMEGYGPNLGAASPPWAPQGGACCGGATDLIAGMAYDAHVNDMRPNDFKNADGTKTYTQTASTYWLDVQEYSQYKDKNQYYLATKYGGFKIPNNWNPASTTPPPTATWHTTPNTQGGDLQPDNYFDANQAGQMVAGLTSAFTSIAKQIAGSSTAFAVQSPRLSATGNVSYGSTYDPTSWTGDVNAYSLSFDASGNPTTTQVWSAQSKLDGQVAANRIIATCCAATGGPGVPFDATDMSSTLPTQYATFAEVPGVSATQQSSSKFLAWLRGDRTQEVGNGGVYRARKAVLGDITDSSLSIVGAPSADFSDANDPGYSTFKSTWANRPTVVYAGANDGMMHAFDGSTTDATQGQELFAYIPSAMYGSSSSAPVSGLASLGAPTGFVHHDMVDATPENFDVDFSHTSGATATSPDWRTMIIGGLGKGGNSYYALDVTDPAGFTSNSALAGKVLWEFTDSTMGYSYGDPSVVKTAQYGWVVILTSGYNTPDGSGYIYLVNPRTGGLLQRIAVGNGADGRSSDGLTYGSAYVLDYTDGTADSYYVGDLNGHLWRLDLTTKTGSYSAPTEIAELQDADGNPQPITTRPLIEIDPSSQKRYVMVGTGKLLARSDITTNSQQTFYAIIDGTASSFNTAATLPAGETFPLTRDNLAQVADSTSTSGTTVSLATGIGSSPSEPSGWYIDLATSSTGGSSERVTVTPTSNYGIVAFAANLPIGDVCSPSGTNRVFGVEFGLAKTVLIDHNGALINASSALSGLATDLTITNVGGTLHITEGTSTGAVGNVPGNLSSGTNLKQLNWNEIPSAE